MTSKDKKFDDSFQMAWFSKASPSGMRTADVDLEEVKNFAFNAFGRLDANSDGFIERKELQAALDHPGTSEREKSFITFLIHRIDEIKDAYQEEWAQKNEGISRVDIQEYFRKLSPTG